MTYFWDTSAMINAAVSETVQARLDTGDHFSRVHAFSEFFAIMTGRGIDIGGDSRVVWSREDTIEWLRHFAARIRFEEFAVSEFLEGLRQNRGIQGAHVYDFGHALAAIRANADVVLTRNPADFVGLVGAAKIEHP